MKKIGFFTLTAIQAGIYICMSSIMAGHMIYKDVGMKGAFLGVIFGSFLLWLLSMIFVKLSLQRPIPLIDITQEYFGNQGAKICGFAMAISLVGWFALQTEIIAKSIYYIMPQLPKEFWIVVLSALVIVNVIKGMNWIGRVADFSVPFLLLIMIIAAFKLYDPTALIPDSEWSGRGILLVMALSLAGVIDIPTYFCVAKGSKDAFAAVSVIYLILLPAMAFLGILFGWLSRAQDFVTGLLGLGGPFWQCCLIIFIILAGWTTNNGNLYSASIALKPCTSLTHNKRILLAGIAGGLAALSGVIDRFVEVLSGMSIVLASLGAAILICFCAAQLKYIKQAENVRRFYVISIVIGSVIGIVSQFTSLKLTQFGFMDSFIATSLGLIVYEGMRYAKKNRS